MAQYSSIEWTDFTWNPTRGCSRVSEGCRHCYAEGIAARFSGPGKAYEGLAKRVNGEPRWTGVVRLVPSVLDWPLRTRKAAEKFRAKHGRRPKVFVNSMSDLFHEKLTDAEIAAVFGVMLLADHYTFQVLTKRPERAAEWLRWAESNPLRIGTDAESAERFDGGPAATCLALLGAQVPASLAKGPLFTAVLLGGVTPSPTASIRSLWPLPNVWLGTSVEDQPTADDRLRHLCACPAAVRFASYEPALGPVDFSRFMPRPLFHCSECGQEKMRPRCAKCGTEDNPTTNWIIGLDLIIVGGESGHGARPFDVARARSAVEQCRAAGVACFVKQQGRYPVSTDPADAKLSIAVPQMRAPNGQWFDAQITLPKGENWKRWRLRLRDSHGGDPAEWPEDLRVREMPSEQAP